MRSPIFAFSPAIFAPGFVSLARSAALLGACLMFVYGTVHAGTPAGFQQPDSASAGTLVVQPAQLRLAATKPVADLLLRNDASEVRIINIDINAWQQVGGIDQLVPSSKLIVHPEMVRLEPGESATVRVGLKMSGPLWEEQAFQVQLTETSDVPDIGASTGWTAASRTNRRMGVPVFLLPPGAVNPRISWHANRNPEGVITLKASNSGRAHVQLHSASLAGPDGQVIEVPGLSTVILPGGSRSWKLLEDAMGGLWRVTANTSAGPMQAELELEPGLSTSSSVTLAE
jgi:fimbrial chaperone protein